MDYLEILSERPDTQHEEGTPARSAVLQGAEAGLLPPGDTRARGDIRGRQGVGDEAFRATYSTRSPDRDPR